MDFSSILKKKNADGSGFSERKKKREKKTSRCPPPINETLIRIGRNRKKIPGIGNCTIPIPISIPIPVPIPIPVRFLNVKKNDFFFYKKKILFKNC